MSVLLHSASVSLLAFAQGLYPLRQSLEAGLAGENLPRQAQTPCVPIGNPSEQGFVVMSDVPLPSAITDISDCAVPSCTHQSFTHVCPCGHSGLSVVQRHTRSAGGSEKQDDSTSKERTASLMLFLLVRWLERIGGWGWSRWAALIKPLHHLIEILRQAACARISGQSANLVMDGRRHLATSNQDWDVARFTCADAMFAPVALRFHTYGIALPELATRYVDTVRQDIHVQAWIHAACAETAIIPEEERGEPMD